MNSLPDVEIPAPLSFEERVYKFVDEKLGIHREHPKRYLVTAYLSALTIAAANDKTGMFAKLDGKARVAPITRVLREELLVDNITCFLMVRKDSIVVKEATMEAVAKLCDKYNILINANPFTVEAVRYMKEKSMAFPYSMAMLPAYISTDPISKENCSAVFVYSLSKEKLEMVHSHVYNASDLLAMARKKIVGDVVVDLNNIKSYRGVSDPLDVNKHAVFSSSPWSGKNPTDFIEMLRKTAIKNFIKYFSLK